MSKLCIFSSVSLSILLLFGSCTSHKKFIVAPKTIECQYNDVNYCLLIKEKEEDNWMAFSNTIQGFDYQEGTQYTIKVLRRRYNNGFKYELEEVIESSVMNQAQNTNPFQGKSWKAIRMKESGVTTQFSKEQELTFNASEPAMSGNAGCNRFFGNYTFSVNEKTISFGAIGSTQMMCDEESMKEERSILSLLEQATTYDMDGEDLTIESESAILFLELK